MNFVSIKTLYHHLNRSNIDVADSQVLYFWNAARGEESNHKKLRKHHKHVARVSSKIQDSNIHMQHLSHSCITVYNSGTSFISYVDIFTV